MDRIEKVREKVDEILLNMAKDEARRHAYLHLYGVAQACALISLKRKENAELPVIAGMLHDIYTYANLDSQDHAHKGAEMARNILNSLGEFSDDEINMICTAIYNHSHAELRLGKVKHGAGGGEAAAFPGGKESERGHAVRGKGIAKVSQQL